VQELRYVLARTYLGGQSENQNSQENLIVLGISEPREANLENATSTLCSTDLVRELPITNLTLQRIPMDYNRGTVSATPFLDEQYLEQDPLLRVFAFYCDVRTSQRSRSSQHPTRLH